MSTVRVTKIDGNVYFAVGLIAFVLYVLTVPAANYMIEHIGSFCVPKGPCVWPVWPGVYAPSGSLMIGFSLVLRDVVQRALGAHIGLIAIFFGAIMAAGVAPAAVVAASVTSFVFSELVDFAVYTPLQRKRFVLAVACSGVVGLVVDGVLFLTIAFGSLDLLLGIVLIKLYAVLVALPVMVWVRRMLPVSA